MWYEYNEFWQFLKIEGNILLRIMKSLYCSRFQNKLLILAILGKSHYLLYGLVPAIQPRMLVTFDEKLNSLPVSVRVGQAVDVVGQAGKPKTITGNLTYRTCS